LKNTKLTNLTKNEETEEIYTKLIEKLAN